jgi:hypothetical protein
MEPIEGSETSAFKTQTPGNYPKENILHKEQGESLKSRNITYTFKFKFKNISTGNNKCNFDDQDNHDYDDDDDDDANNSNNNNTLFSILIYVLNQQSDRHLTSPHGK